MSIFARAGLVVVVACLTLGDGRAASGQSTTRRGGSPDLADYRVVGWNTADGLPQSSILDIEILDDGEMWLATFGGLVRFDGHTFKVLDMAADEGLPANRIVALEVDARQSILFLTQQGHLGRMKQGRAVVLALPPDGARDFGELIVTTTGLIASRSFDGRVWTTDGRVPWRQAAGPPAEPPVWRIGADGSGAVWLQGTDIIRRLDDQSSRATGAFPDQGITIEPRARSGAWLGIGSSLSRVGEGRLEPLRIEPPLTGTVQAIASESESILWVAVPGDIFRVERQADGVWRRSRLPLSMSRSYNIKVLRRDLTGAIWIGTAGGGLYRVNPYPTERFKVSAEPRDVSALADDGDGGALITTGCGSLFQIGERGEVRPIPFGGAIDREPTTGCQVALDSDKRGDIWARFGPNLLQRHAGHWRLITSALRDDNGPIAVSSDGSIWVVSRSGSVEQVSPNGVPVQQLTLPSPLASASAAADGSIWIGGDGTVFHVSGGGIERFGSEHSVPRGQVRDIVAETNGAVWIATYGGGIGRLAGGRVARITAESGLPDNSISRLILDRAERMWASTNRGIAVMDKRSLEEVAEGKRRSVAPVVLGLERGVPEPTFGSPAGFADASGHLWFGTVDGVVRVDGSAFPFNRTPPTVRVEEIRLDDRPLPIGTIVDVPVQGRLRFSLVSFGLLYPELLMFRYRFEGGDRDWIDAGTNRTVEWTPPGPGRYRLIAEARNEDGIWSTTPAMVVLDVRPAWWQTTWFRAAVPILVVLLGVAAVRARIAVIERRHAERLRRLDEQRQVEERLLTLRVQLERVSRVALAGELSASIAHEVRQPIGAIVSNAEAGRRYLRDYLKRPADLEQLFDDIVSDSLRASEVIRGVSGLLEAGGPEMTAIDLSALVVEVLPVVRRELRENRIDVQLALAEHLPPVEGFRVQLGQVVINLVSNACEALAGVDGVRTLRISTAATDTQVLLSVCDNGPGPPVEVIDRMFEPFVTSKADGLGVGLAICRTIAERHGGRLTPQRQADGGFCMTLSLPPATTGESAA